MPISAMAKKTWWNELRVSRNFRFADLVELFPTITNGDSIGAWFSGQYVPKDEYIKILCDFFDVDFEEGKAHFIADHKIWESSKHKDSRITTGKALGRGEMETTGESVLKGTTRPATESKADIFEMVYGKLSYELFRKFCDLVAVSDANALELIYGKVTFEEFITIWNIIKEA